MGGGSASGQREGNYHETKLLSSYCVGAGVDMHEQASASVKRELIQAEEEFRE